MAVIDYLIPEGKSEATVQCYAPCRADSIERIFAAAEASLGTRRRLYKIGNKSNGVDVLLLEIDATPTDTVAAISECVRVMRNAGARGDLIFLFDGSYDGSERLVGNARHVYAFQRKGNDAVINLDSDFLHSDRWTGFVDDVLASVRSD